MSLSLVPPSSMSEAYSEFNGGVSDAIDPRTVWVEKKTEGDCRLITGPRLLCAPSCESGKICAGMNSCIPEPVALDAGTVSITGLNAEFSAVFNGSSYYKQLTGTFPPVSAGTEVTFSAPGSSKVPAFSITSSGIDPLQVAEADITLDTSKPLTISWTPPTKAGTSHVIVSLDLAHHGNVAAKLVCDVADSGSTTIPVSMLTALAAEGVAGYPSVALARRAVNSISVGGGCVEFAVSSSVDRPLVLPGVTSCGCPKGDCSPCTELGQTCKVDYTCG